MKYDKPANQLISFQCRLYGSLFVRVRVIGYFYFVVVVVAGLFVCFGRGVGVWGAA